MQTLSLTEVRRLALVRAGLLRPQLIGLRGSGQAGALAVIEHFGYLQLDSVSIAGARTHGIVLHSRIKRMARSLPESLLQREGPLFEYWGHEACWLPLSLYPLFGFRRKSYRVHPWWGDIVGAHPKQAKQLLRRIREHGPLRSADIAGERKPSGWWDHALSKKLLSALWCSGELAIAERRNFIRTFDLAERVIPRALLEAQVSENDAIEALLLRALAGHGWATTGLLAATWRLRSRGPQIKRALARLQEKGAILPCALEGKPGWLLPDDLALAARARRLRPRSDQAVLLSPFDPLLWQRARVRQLFDFEQVLEIYKPAPTRVYGYYCLPVLAGERLIARYDLKARRKQERLEVLSLRYEGTGTKRAPSAEVAHAARVALERYANAVGLAACG